MGDVIGRDRFKRKFAENRDKQELMQCLLSDLRAIADDILAVTGMKEYVVFDKYTIITIKDHEV